MSAVEVDNINEVANQLFAAIENSDRTAVDRLWRDDILVWRPGARRDNDKARALRVIDWFISVTAERGYEVLDRQIFDGGSGGSGGSCESSGSDRGFVQQHVLHATGHAGQSISLRVCIVIKVGADGLIHRIDEYFDPADLAPLLD
jgi:ketosteroid isomerase-like protein